MKVLYSCLSESWGGLEMRTIQGAEQLIKKGIAVDILCIHNSKIYAEAKTSGINTVAITASGYFHPIQIIKLSRIIKKNIYDIIHSQLSKDLWTIVPALKAAGLKTPLLLTKRMESSVMKRDFLHRRLYNRVAYVLAISNIIKENVLKTCPVQEEKVLLHYNGVDIKKFDPSLTDREKIRKESGINTEEIVIGMLSRLTYGKGHKEFLYAAIKLNNEFPNLKFLIAGESDDDEKNYEEKIKTIISEKNLSDNVILTGFRKDTPDLLASMDIFVFPSHAESFGSALIEAMAMEKPSVSTNSHGILDIVIDGVTGYLFERKNSEDLYNKLKLLINSPEKRKKYGEAARKRVIENFDIEKQTEKLVELYKKIID
jgi:D-inositol-3-phosphate glycosyltransferase